MGPEGAVNILYRRELAADAPPEARAAKVAEYTENFANPYIAARRGYVDEIIEPSETRRQLIAAFALLEGKRATLPEEEAREHPALRRDSGRPESASSSPTAARSRSASSAPAATSGIETVAVFSDADRAAPHVALADHAVRLGPAPARESYLSDPGAARGRAEDGRDARPSRLRIPGRERRRSRGPAPTRA